MVPFYKKQSRKSSPRRGGPAKVLEIDDAGATVSFQSQTSKVARYCVRRRMKDSEIQEGEGRATTTLGESRMGPIAGELGLSPSLQVKLPKDCLPESEELRTASSGESAESSEEPLLASPRLIPIPESPTNSGDPTFSPVMEDSGNISPSRDKQCAPSQAPECVSINYDHLSYEQIHDLRKARGYHKKDAKAALKTRSEAMGAVGRHPVKQTENDMDTSSSILGKAIVRWRMGQPWK